MKILLIIPTEPELNLLKGYFLEKEKPCLNTSVEIHGHEIMTRLTGAGMVNTAAKTAMYLAGGTYDLAIQAGIAGSFNSEIIPGSVVEIVSEFLPELGAEDGSSFIPFSDLGIYGPEHHPQTKNGILLNSRRLLKTGLPETSGITVNRVTGSEESRKAILSHYEADIETMEGYAFFFSCLLFQTPFLSLRGVSNRVGKRDRSSWKIDEALASLAHKLNEVFLLPVAQ
jgi:futalosine hydrolase